jgi:hypothetical protein
MLSPNYTQLEWPPSIEGVREGDHSFFSIILFRSTTPSTISCQVSVWYSFFFAPSYSIFPLCYRQSLPISPEGRGGRTHKRRQQNLSIYSPYGYISYPLASLASVSSRLPSPAGRGRGRSQIRRQLKTWASSNVFLLRQ